jgi:hypothetical protein
MEYFDIRDLNFLHAFRRALVTKLVAVRMQVGPMKRVCIDAHLLHRLEALNDDEIFIQPSINGSPRTLQGLHLIGRAGMRGHVEISSADGKLSTEFEITREELRAAAR